MRCINLDWLEVYCLEPPTIGLDADYYRSKGYHVSEREYGTPNYNQMFTFIDDFGYSYLEIRRQPKDSNTFLPANACHIRLSNRTCYTNSPVSLLQSFLATHAYTFVSIKRVDICLDFEVFDYGDNPQRFVKRYIAGKYSKINQADIAARGYDAWTERTWHYIHWGSKASPISTKLYDKTRELKDAHDKPYIRQAWFAAGLVTDPVGMTKLAADGSTYTPQIWRLEFSIQSGRQKWLTIDIEDNGCKRKRSIPNNLAMYDSKEKLLGMFASLQEHYFRFHKFKEGVPKYKCERKLLFKFSTSEEYYKLDKIASDKSVSSDRKRLLRLLESYALTETRHERVKLATQLADVLREDQVALLAENVYDRRTIIAIRACIQACIQGMADPKTAITDIYKFLDNCADEIW